MKHPVGKTASGIYELPVAGSITEYRLEQE